MRKNIIHVRVKYGQTKTNHRTIKKQRKSNQNKQESRETTIQNQLANKTRNKLDMRKHNYSHKGKRGQN